MANREEIPQTSPAEIEKLIEQIRANNLDEGAKAKIERLLSVNDLPIFPTFDRLIFPTPS